MDCYGVVTMDCYGVVSIGYVNRSTSELIIYSPDIEPLVKGVSFNMKHAQCIHTGESVIELLL